MSDNIPNCHNSDEELEHRRNHTTLNEKFGISLKNILNCDPTDKKVIEELIGCDEVTYHEIMKDWLIPRDYLSMIRPQDPQATQVRELFDRMRESVRSMPAIPIVTAKAMLPEEVDKIVGRSIDVMALYQRQRASMPESDYRLDYILTRKEIDSLLERSFDPSLDKFIETRNPVYMTMQCGKHRSNQLGPNKLFYAIDPSLKLGPMNISRTEITYDTNGIATTTIETVLFAGDIRGNLVTVIQRQKRVQVK